MVKTAYEIEFDLLGLPNPASAKLWRQVVTAIRHAATSIRYESTGYDNHAARFAWATEAELDPTAKWNQMKARILEDATIKADPENVTDSYVQTVVNSLIDTYAVV